MILTGHVRKRGVERGGGWVGGVLCVCACLKRHTAAEAGRAAQLST